MRDLLQRARELASHRLPRDDLGDLIKRLATSFVQREVRANATWSARTALSERHCPKPLPTTEWLRVCGPRVLRAAMLVPSSAGEGVPAPRRPQYSGSSAKPRTTRIEPCAKQSSARAASSAGWHLERRDRVYIRSWCRSRAWAFVVGPCQSCAPRQTSLTGLRSPRANSTGSRTCADSTPM